MRSILFSIVLILDLQAGAITAAKKACKAGKGVRCKNLGLFYQTGQKVKKNYHKAEVYYTKACDLKNSEGCWLLGELYYYGQEVDQNNSKAEYYYDISCKLNNKKACKKLQKLLNPTKTLKEKLERLKQEQEKLIREAEVLDDT